MADDENDTDALWLSGANVSAVAKFSRLTLTLGLPSSRQDSRTGEQHRRTQVFLSQILE